MQFVLEEWLQIQESWREIPAFADVDRDTVGQVLESAAQFASEVIAPLNSTGDLEGARYDSGRVVTPQGFADAYRAYVEAGWGALALPADHGGQGLPLVLNCVLTEMLTAANHSFTMYVALAHGACECVAAHAPASLQQQYLPKMVSGEDAVSMCLTEAHAGSDLGLLRTRAEADPAVAGQYRLSGTKIFISGGEHDLTDNIVHLVLARLPDAPAGTKGISLFLVPKILPDGRRNTVRCDGIEKKMGIKGSATCVMNFDNAIGWLASEPHRGLAAMFVMMNSARLHVAMQGIGHAEAAYQNALQYARERRQMRAPAATRTQTAAADSIIEHPAIRRTLLQLRAYTEGQRALAYWCGHLIDVAEHHNDPAQRKDSHALASLLTPIAKAFFTDNGFTLASSALQVFGGHGYVHDNAIEQTLRDSRIGAIYEGTNEIQAIDLLVRKVLGDNGATFARLIAIVDEEVKRCELSPACREYAQKLRTAGAAQTDAIAAIRAGAQADPELPYRAANDFLRAAGLFLLAYAWARAARLAEPKARDSMFHADKLTTANFYFQWVFPEFDHCMRMVATARHSLPAIAQQA
jgi:alkylation response protein AidB-like acyl-CoA dehydrogenase